MTDARKYDTPRWQDAGAVNRRKQHVRWATKKDSGCKGVLKHVSGKKRRFYDEATNMEKFNGTSGIMPVWDIDKAQSNEPRWYAMPRATLLEDALGYDATLRDVVGHIAFLADVLAGLADQDTYHRDIKPANIFWWDGGPVLADFGIAAWGVGGQADVAHRASPTRKTEKLGSANFIAPEMRYDRPPDRGKHADVYSLAKTLFVLAHPSLGPYSPDGTHRADSEEFSLWETGGGRSLPALRHVLEAATEFDPHRRLSMTDFRDELHAWLTQYSDMQFRRRGDRRLMFRRGLEEMRGLVERDRQDREVTKLMMLPCIHEIAEALTSDPDAWTERLDHDSGAATLGDYGWEPNEEEGFIPDNGTIWMATTVFGGRRIIVEAVLDQGVCFLAESHVEGPPWKLEQQWGRTEWRRPRMPRTADQIKNLTADMVTWIANTVADSPSARPAEPIDGCATPRSVVADP